MYPNLMYPTSEEVSMSTTILCPDCGWTGETAELDATDGVQSCPICDTDIEFMD